MNVITSINDFKNCDSIIEYTLGRRWPTESHFKVVCVLDKTDAEKRSGNFGDSALGKAIGNEAEKMTRDVAKKLALAFNRARVSHQVLYGVEKDVVLDCASKWPADLVILGSNSHNQHMRILSTGGSLTVARYGKNTPARYNVSGGKLLSNILIAADASPHSRAALDYVLAMPWPENSRFKILTVVKPLAAKHQDGFSALYSRTMLPMESTADHDLAKAFLDQSLSKLHEKFTKDQVTSLVLEGDSGDTIIKIANSWQSGLIIMGSRGHNYMERLWHGSVSQEVVSQAKCPVEVIMRDPGMKGYQIAVSSQQTYVPLPQIHATQQAIISK